MSKDSLQSATRQIQGKPVNEKQKSRHWRSTRSHVNIPRGDVKFTCDDLLAGHGTQRIKGLLLVFLHSSAHVQLYTCIQLYLLYILDMHLCFLPAKVPPMSNLPVT